MPHYVTGEQVTIGDTVRDIDSQKTGKVVAVDESACRITVQMGVRDADEFVTLPMYFEKVA